MTQELPIGFSMALAQDEAAMKQFSTMPEAKKQAILQRARNVNSKQEMQQLVWSLGQGGARE